MCAGPLTAATTVAGRIGLVDLDQPPELVLPHLEQLRVFSGYAGWNSGQLEAEIYGESWPVLDLLNDDPLNDEPQPPWPEGPPRPPRGPGGRGESGVLTRLHARPAAMRSPSVVRMRAARLPRCDPSV